MKVFSKIFTFTVFCFYCISSNSSYQVLYPECSSYDLEESSQKVFYTIPDFQSGEYSIFVSTGEALNPPCKLSFNFQDRGNIDEIIEEAELNGENNLRYFKLFKLLLKTLDNLETAPVIIFPIYDSEDGVHKQSLQPLPTPDPFMQSDPF